MARWNYSGDISLENGGTFWREDGADDYVLAVRVTPCADAGGQNNAFWIESGSIYLPNDDRRKRALECIGWIKDADAPTRAEIIFAFEAYHGLEVERSQCVQIGKQPDMYGRRSERVEPDYILRANASLKRYVKREFLD